MLRMESFIEGVAHVLFTWYVGLLGEDSTPATVPALTTLIGILANVATGYKLSVCSKVLMEHQNELFSKAMVRDALLRFVESHVRLERYEVVAGEAVGARSTFIDETVSPPKLLVGNILKTVALIAANSRYMTQAILNHVECYLGDHSTIVCLINDLPRVVDKRLPVVGLCGGVGPTLAVDDYGYLADKHSIHMLHLHRRELNTVADIRYPIKLFRTFSDHDGGLQQIVIESDYRIPKRHPARYKLPMRRLLEMLYGANSDYFYRGMDYISFDRVGLRAICSERYCFVSKMITLKWILQYSDTNPVFWILSEINYVLRLIRTNSGADHPERTANTLPPFSVVFQKIRADEGLMRSICPTLSLPMCQSVSEFRSKWEGFRASIRSAVLASETRPSHFPNSQTGGENCPAMFIRTLGGCVGMSGNIIECVNLARSIADGFGGNVVPSRGPHAPPEEEEEEEEEEI